MRFAVAASCLLAGAAQAEGVFGFFYDTFSYGSFSAVEKRQSQTPIQVVMEAVSNISAIVTKLEAGVKGFSTKTLLDVRDTSTDTVNTINTAYDRCKDLPDLADGVAYTLVGPIQDLSTLVGGTINTVIAQRTNFQGAAAVVGQYLDMINGSTHAFSDSIVSKLSSTLKPIGDGLTAPIFANLTEAIKAYSKPVLNYDKSILSSDARSIIGSGYSTALFAAALVGLVQLFA